MINLAIEQQVKSNMADYTERSPLCKLSLSHRLHLFRDKAHAAVLEGD